MIPKEAESGPESRVCTRAHWPLLPEFQPWYDPLISKNWAWVAMMIISTCIEITARSLYLLMSGRDLGRLKIKKLDRTIITDF